AGAEPEVAAFGVDYLGRREIQAEPEGLRLFPARGSEEGAQSVGEDPKVVVIENPGLDYGRPPHVFVADRVAEEKVVAVQSETVQIDGASGAPGFLEIGKRRAGEAAEHGIVFQG